MCIGFRCPRGSWDAPPRGHGGRLRFLLAEGVLLWAPAVWLNTYSFVVVLLLLLLKSRCGSLVCERVLTDLSRAATSPRATRARSPPGPRGGRRALRVPLCVLCVVLDRGCPPCLVFRSASRRGRRGTAPGELPVLLLRCLERSLCSNSISATRAGVLFSSFSAVLFLSVLRNF